MRGRKQQKAKQQQQQQNIGKVAKVDKTKNGIEACSKLELKTSKHEISNC